MIEDKKSGYRNKPNRMSELRLWSFLSCFIREVSAVSSIITRNMSVNIWNTCFRVRCPTTVLLNWKSKSCFPWPFSSRKSCWEPVPASALLIPLPYVFAVIRGYWFIRHLKDLPNVENVLWDGFSDLRFIWLLMTKVKSSISCLLPGMWMIGNRWKEESSWKISKENYVQTRDI